MSVSSGVGKDRPPKPPLGCLTNCLYCGRQHKPVQTEAHCLLSLCYRIASSLVLLGLQILILPLFRFSTFVFKRTEEVSCLCLQRASSNLKKKSLWGKKIGKHVFQNLRNHFIKKG